MKSLDESNLYVIPFRSLKNIHFKTPLAIAILKLWFYKEGKRIFL